MQNLLDALGALGVAGNLSQQMASRSDLESMLSSFFPEEAGAPHVVGALDFIFDGKPLSVTSTSDVNALFLRHLPSTCAFFRAPDDTDSARVLETNESEDSLISVVDGWSPLKLINFFLLQSIRSKSGTAAIVATARDEGLSILEWIAYHQVLGFEDFFIYTNDNTDGSLQLLELLARHGVITLINNKVGPKVSPQQKCYEHSLNFLPQLRRYDWVSYLDIDEFLLPLNSKAVALKDLIDQISDQQTKQAISSVFFNWKWFGSGRKFSMESGFVLEKFTEARYDTHGKSLTRLKDIVSMKHVHYPTLLPKHELVDSAFKPVADMKSHPAVYASGQVNHYWNKSFEEFALKKIRGLPSQGIAGKQRDFEQFFAWDTKPNLSAVEIISPEFIDSVHKRYDALSALEGVQATVNDIERFVRAKLDELTREYDLKTLYKGAGQ